jgi:type II secretory pathway component PulK
MKISLQKRSRHTRHGERGMAVIVVLALLALILIYVAANARTLQHLERDVKLLEQKQTHRLAVIIGKTNAVAAPLRVPAVPRPTSPP